MNNSRFDEHIKKQLGDFHPEVPPHIWENIVAEKEKKRPVGLLFLLSGYRFSLILSLIIVSACGILLFKYFHKDDPNNHATLTLLSRPDNQLTKLHNNAVTAPAKQNSTTRVAANIPLKNNKNRSLNPVAVEKQMNGLVIREKSAHAGTTSRAGHKIKVVIDADVTSVLLPGPHNNQRNITTSRSAGLENKEDDNRNLSLMKVKNKTGRSAAKKRVTIENAVTEDSAVTEISPGNTAESIDKNDVSLAKYFLLLHAEPAEKTFAFTIKNISLSALSIPCPESEKNAAGNKRYVEIYGGPDYAFRSFNDTANSTYLQKRKESTRFSSGFSLGLRYTRVFNNAVSFRTGVNYSQLNEKFSFVQGHIVQLLYMINDQGDTTGSYASTGTRYKTTYNRYKTVDIPLIFGYEMGNSRLHTNINAGLIVNAYSWQKGDVLDTNNQPVSITTGKSRSVYQFKTNVGIGFTGGVSFYYKLTNRLHILAEPWFRYNFSAANKAEITLKQKYTTIGARMGLRIDF